jgi:hypothetical protein
VTCESCELRRKKKTEKADIISDEGERMTMPIASLLTMQSAVTRIRPGQRNMNLVADMEVTAGIGLQPNRRIETNKGVAGAVVESESESVRVVRSIHRPVEIETRREGDTDCITGYKAVDGHVCHS